MIVKYPAEKELNLTATLDTKLSYSVADFVVIAALTDWTLYNTEKDTKMMLGG